MPELMKLLKDIWFTPYRRWRAAASDIATPPSTPVPRRRPNDSSGFEHVFVGEESRGKIIGLHNWIQVYLEEKKGNIDYLGWTGRQDKHDDGVTLATIKFAWADDKPGEVTIKPVSTILVGATPEFEIAALSLAFLCGEQEGDNRMELGRERIKIVCYPHDGKGGPKVASAYIELA